ncbi:hypothetical protein FACS1894191_1640 [Clostridia bacterium]|nr:hypothetical protein FACS1894191_1640 [Clostridia bacterium]
MPKRISHSQFTPEQILKKLKEYPEQFKGASPSGVDLNRLHASQPRLWPSASQVRLAFGSHNNGLIAAGLPINAKGRPMSDEEMAEKVAKLGEQLGHPPSSEEIFKHKLFCRATLLTRTRKNPEKATEIYGIANVQIHAEYKISELLEIAELTAESLGDRTTVNRFIAEFRKKAAKSRNG